MSHADICQTVSSRVEGSRICLKLRKAFSKKPLVLDVLFKTSNKAGKSLGYLYITIL